MTEPRDDFKFFEFDQKLSWERLSSQLRRNSAAPDALCPEVRAVVFAIAEPTIE
jgi:hypothetical protein